MTDGPLDAHASSTPRDTTPAEAPAPGTTATTAHEAPAPGTTSTTAQKAPAPDTAAEPTPGHPAGPPRAAKRPDRQAPRVHHGHTFEDPWEWLRDKEDPEVLDHLRAENAWTDRVTAPTRDLAARIVGEIRSHTLLTDVTVPVREGDFWYFRRTTEGHSYASHHRVPVLDPGDDRALPPVPEPGVPLPGEQLLVDEEEWARGQEFFALSSLTPSPDGRLLAWLRDTRGDERWTIVVQDASTGRVLDETVSDTGYGLAWSADSSTLLYCRVDDAWRQFQVWTHRVRASTASAGSGATSQDRSTTTTASQVESTTTNASAGSTTTTQNPTTTPAQTPDRLVLEEPDERFDLWFEPARDPAWVPIHSTSTTTAEAWLWPTAHPDAAPIPVTGRTRDVLVSLEPAGDHLLLVHSATSREGTLAAAPLPADLSGWLRPLDEGGARTAATDRATPLLAPPDSWVAIREAAPGERILDVEAYSTFCLVTLRAEGLTQVEVRTRSALVDPTGGSPDLARVWGPGRFVTADSPVRTITTASGTRFADRTFAVEVQSLTVPPAVEVVDPVTGGRTPVRRLEVPGWDPSTCVEERLWVTARDGHTRIPVSLVHRRDVTPDGTAPGWLYGYGAYEVSIDPEFSAVRLPLLERGVVHAIAHVRGGGELGRAWYEDGRLGAKEHTFTDFVDVGRALVERGWVAPGRLVAEGRSAGGLLMGAVTNLAPDLFRVVVAGVPFVDALTTILDPSLPLTAGEWEEWGNPIEDPAIYDAMRAYTPYENVEDGVALPAVFASTSLNDTRVFFVEPAKWVQRLREATSSDALSHPVVLRTEMVAGHGGRSGREGRWASRAEEFAFALGQVGVTR